MMKLNDIQGQYHAKRAIEVALAGGHSITFVGNEDATDLACWCLEHGFTTAYAISQCPCGKYSNLFTSPRSTWCECEPKDVLKWWRGTGWTRAMENDIVVVIPPDSRFPGGKSRWREGPGEPEEDMLARVENVGARPSVELDEAGKMLMRCAVVQLQMDEERVGRVLAVTQTIAALAHADSIHVAYLAEALQYHPSVEMMVRNK